MERDDPTALTEAVTFEKDTVVKWKSFGAGPPLIFCHGTPWSSRLWAPIARCFASSFTVYLYDMPGYGESINTGIEPTYPRQTEVFVFMLRHWQQQQPTTNTITTTTTTTSGGAGTFRPHVVAHDIGGHVALRALLTVEDVRFASLMLVDCGAAFPVDEPFFSLVRSNVQVFCDLPAELHEALVRRYIRGASHRGLRADQEDALVAPWTTTLGKPAFYRRIGSQRNEDIEALAAHYREVESDELGCPLRILWARNDTWVPVERAGMLQERIGGTVRLIEDAGHLVQLDAPETLTWELSQWLAQQVKVMD